jgi:PAS domain S-box-containing protein
MLQFIAENSDTKTSQRMLINKITLKFKDNNEEKFQTKYFHDSLIQFRVSFILIIFLFSIFGFLDATLAEEYVTVFLFIRFAIVIPLFLFTYLFSFHKNFSKIWQWLLFVCFITGGGGITVMTLLLPENYAYYAGLMLIFSAGYFFIKLRFTLATIAGWLTVLFFNIGAFSFSRIEPIMILFNNFFFISANLIGMFAAYYIEYFTRRDFILNQQLDNRNAEIVEANKSLESKVEERTRELKFAKEKAEENEKIFKQIIESQTEGIGFVNQNEIYEFANSASEKIFEVNTGELIGSSILDFIEEDETDKLNQQINNRIEGNSNTYELKIITKKKNTKYILVSATPKFDENNTYLGAYGVFRDITDKKLLELNFNQQLYFTKALNEIAEVIVSNDNANHLLEESNRIIGETLKLDRSLIYEISFEKKYIFGLCEWLKENHPDIEPTKDTYPLEMFLSPFTEIRNTQKYLISHFNDVNEIFEKDESAKILHHHFKIKSLMWYPFAFSNQGYYLFTLNQILKKRKWTTSEIGFLESAAKQITLALLKIKLLDERKKAEIQLKINEERFKNLFDYTLNGVRIVNKDGIIIDQNPAMVEITGNKTENTIGKFVWDIIYNQAPDHQKSPEFFERIKNKSLSILKSENFPDEWSSMVNLLQHTDGSLRTIKSNYFIVKSDIETLYYTVIQDITELKTAENELKKQIQLRQFLSEIASSYINLSIEDMELEINDSLAKICGFFNHHSKPKIITGLR